MTGREIFNTISHCVTFRGVIWKIIWKKSQGLPSSPCSPSRGLALSGSSGWGEGSSTYGQWFHIKDEEVEGHGQANGPHQPDVLPRGHPHQGLVFWQAATETWLVCDSDSNRKLWEPQSSLAQHRDPRQETAQDSLDAAASTGLEISLAQPPAASGLV